MVIEPNDSEQTSVSPVVAGLLCRCPNCGKGSLYDGFLTIAPKCGQCELDFSNVDTGDGPAVFIILIVGAIVVFGSLFVEVAYQPPYWVHAVTWLPIVIVLPLLLLRPFKAVLTALQFHHKAEQAQVQGDE